jgi:hypothetical protein
MADGTRNTQRRGTVAVARIDDELLVRHVSIKPLNMQEAEFPIVGTTMLCVHRFGKKAQELMIAKQRAGEQSRKNKKHDARDFEQDWQEARHVSVEGWDGVPCSSFRNAMISACRVAGFQMTRAKLSIFVLRDGLDRADGLTELVRITKGDPLPWDKCIIPARNDDGSIDLRCRPTWAPGWEMNVRIRWDLDQFSAEDVTNLLNRAGQQVGIAEGRPDSKKSAGLGWGLFRGRE